MIRLYQLIILGFAILIATPKVVAQDDKLITTDSIPITTDSLNSEVINLNEISDADSTSIKKERFKLIKSILDKKYPNPNRAAALSLLAPGAGQIYNKKYWKLPFVYGALGGLGYMAYFNQDQYVTFRDAYLAEVDDDILTINPFSTLSETALLTRRDGFDKRRQQAYVFFVLGWILNSVDAYVDAHLASFDVNEDISAHIQPVGVMAHNISAYGLSISFTHKTKNSNTPLFKY